MVQSCVCCRSSRAVALIVFLLLFYIFFGEVGVHFLYSWWWAWPRDSTHFSPISLDHAPSNEMIHLKPAQNEQGEEDRKPTKILIIADPHIQCTFDRYEPWLYRWDSDHYVTTAFSLLMTGMTPDIVVALGDVFAEGYKASKQQWIDYTECLYKVLAVPSDVRMVLLPGDNDIGGEGVEEMRKTVNERYISEFGPFNQVISINGFTLIKINTVSYIHGQPRGVEEDRVKHQVSMFLQQVADNTSRGLLKRPVIVLLHVPVLYLPSSIANVILNSLRPDYIFSGHVHHELKKTHSYPSGGGGGGGGGGEEEKRVMEYTVPTCSYRMGEAHMGVGAALIDHHGNLRYTVLWLPPRFPILISYILISSVLLIIIICQLSIRLISFLYYFTRLICRVIFILPRKLLL